VPESAAGHGFRAVGVDEFGVFAGLLEGGVEQELVAEQAAAELEHVVGWFAGDLVDERALAAGAGLVDACPQCVGGFGMQGDDALGVGLAGRDVRRH
jgi:hypothetical protein